MFGYKVTENQQGLNTDFRANSLSFSMPIHTHKSGNHSNSYGHPKTAIMWSFRGQAGDRFRSNGLENLLRFQTLTKITNFKLMTCTHDLIVLTKNKRSNPLPRTTHIQW
jgi:hypothetical protein